MTNFETVKLFNNEGFEAKRYDDQMKHYENASLKVEWSLAGLNFGQRAILLSGMSTLMYMAGQGIVDGSMTVGDRECDNGRKNKKGQWKLNPHPLDPLLTLF